MGGRRWHRAFLEGGTGKAGVGIVLQPATEAGDQEYVEINLEREAEGSINFVGHPSRAIERILTIGVQKR